MPSCQQVALKVDRLPFGNYLPKSHMVRNSVMARLGFQPLPIAAEMIVIKQASNAVHRKVTDDSERLRPN